MVTTKLTPIYDSFLDYLVEKATPQEIIAFQIPESVQQRATVLLARNNAGILTPEEAIELEQMQQLDRLVAVLKAKALEAMG